MTGPEGKAQTAFDTLPEPALTFAFDVVVQLARPENHGMTSAGVRRVVPILGGEVTGEIEAEILPGGADWQLVDSDGTIRVDARCSARTADGELMLFHATGLRTGSALVLKRLGQGEDIDPSEYVFRTTLRVETSAPRLAHLQRSMFLASARRQASAVSYRTYRIQ